MTMHHLSAEEIAAYLDGEVTGEERRDTEHHLESCDTCRSELDDQLFIKNLMNSLGEVDAPRSFAITPHMVSEPAPLTSPGSPSAPGAPVETTERSSGSIVRFEPVARLLSIAAVLAFLVLSGAQITGLVDNDSNSSQGIEQTETASDSDALQNQEPALARGEVREQGESAAANAQPLDAVQNLGDTETWATDNGLTPIEYTTIAVGIVALASIASWILIHYRAGSSS